MLHAWSPKMLEEQQASIPKPESSAPKTALSQEPQELLHAPQTAGRSGSLWHDSWAGEKNNSPWSCYSMPQWDQSIQHSVKSQASTSPMATPNPPWWVVPAANPSFANTVLGHTNICTLCRLHVFQELHGTQPCAKLLLLEQEHIWSKSTPCKKQTPIISILLFLTAACTWKAKVVCTQFIRKSGDSFPFPLSLGH